MRTNHCTLMRRLALIATTASAILLCCNPAVARAAPLIVVNCVGGPPIRLSDPDQRAMLDNVDLEQVRAAILARYPALANDGFAPRQIMMWKKSADEWLFASLIPNPELPETSCFTATFEASVFDITPVLTQKYFFAGNPRS